MLYGFIGGGYYAVSGINIRRMGDEFDLIKRQVRSERGGLATDAAGFAVNLIPTLIAESAMRFGV